MNRWVAARRAEVGHEDGALAIFAGFVLLLIFAVGALTIDLGTVAAASRDQQGAVDRAALDGVLALQTADPASAPAAIERSLARNQGMWGRMASPTVDTEVRPVRCTADGPAPLPPGAWGDPNASGVQVVTHTEVSRLIPSLFVPAGDTTRLERHATACAAAIGAVRVGSATASVSDGLLDDLLAGLTGGAVDVSLLSYRGIADAFVDLSLLATELGVGSAEQLVDADLTVGQLIGATVAALEADPSRTGAIELAGLLAPLGTLPVAALSFPLGEILKVDTGGATSGLDANIDAVDLVVAALQIANGDTAIDLEVTALGNVLPVRVSVIRPPVIAIGRPGRVGDDPAGAWRTVAEASQVAVEIDLPIGQALVPVLGEENAARVADYRQRVTAATSTTQVRRILEDLEAELEELRAHLVATGRTSLLGVVDALLSSVVGLIGSIVGGLLCLFTPLACAKSDARDRIDEFESLLGQLEAQEAGSPVDPRPTLRIVTGEASAALAAVDCATSGSATVVAETTAASVTLPRTRVLDLGPLGRIDLALDTALGEAASTTLSFPGPHPGPSQSAGGTGTVGLASLLPSADLSGSQLVFIPLGEVLGQVTTLVSPLFGVVDGILEPVLDTLGAQLGGADVDVLHTACGGRYLVR